MNKNLAAERRRRLITRALPISAIALGSFIFGAAVGKPGEPHVDAAERFSESWAAGDYAAMYRELNETSRRITDRAGFEAAYREAAETATLRGVRSLDPEDASETSDGAVVPVPIEVSTVAFGRFVAPLEVRYEEGGVSWNPSMTFPGLGPGEKLESEAELAPRAPILARDGTTLAEGPAEAREHPLGSAAIDITGEVGEAEEEDLLALSRRGYPPGTPVGVTGLERAFNTRLAGTPGGTLSAVGENGRTVLAESKPRPGAPLKTTIDPDLQTAAVEALAGRSGGVAVLDARSGDVRALAGYAFSAPQPPGSTFKLVTTSAALEDGVVSLDDSFPVVGGADVGGRFISNANGELCGGTFAESFAHSCNSVFAPLGTEIGSDSLVAEAEEFGFNSPPTLYADEIVEEVEPSESTIPEELGEDVDVGVSAIGQGEVLATPLAMASVAQTIANDGVRMPTSIVVDKDLRPEPARTRVMPRRIARQITDLMVGVVEGGTGYAAAVEGVQVAGKTGTAELGPVEGQENLPEPEQIKDAWFTAFAPARKPRLVVAVMLIDAKASGGEVAAPAAGLILSSGL